MNGFDYVTGDVQGLKTMFIIPRIPEAAPAAVREGIARRRLATVQGECPCGGRRARLSRQQRRQAERKGAVSLGSLLIEHEDGCAAISADVVEYLTGRRVSGA